MPRRITYDVRRTTFDVVVVGGGLAGVCAAISAARLGCRTALVHDRPVLGGNSSSEIRVPVGGCGDFNAWGKETGIIEEIITESKVRQSRQMTGITNSLWDLTLYDLVRQEKNIDLFLNTSCRKAIMKGKNRIKSTLCVQLGSEQEFILEGDLFIDSSGDGALAFSAGAKFRMGEESGKEFNESLAPKKASKGTMGNSLMFEARDLGYPVKFTPPPWASKFPSEEDLSHKDHADTKGNVFMSGHWWIEIGFPFDTISDNEKIRDILLAQLMGVWDHIKNTGNHKAENLALHWVGALPGKRESRRFIGDYILTENDVRSARPFQDSAAYGGWFIDVHTIGGILKRRERPEPSHGNPAEMDRRFVYPYPIPYRCLYSKNIKNLFMAGRNISTTRVALGTTRLMATCAVMGQAAGTAACLCKKYKKLPRDIYAKHISELQQALLKQDCYIPYIKNEDALDLARTASVTASSEAELDLARETSGSHSLSIPRGQVFPVSGKKINSIELLLENKSNSEKEITLHLCKTDHVWNCDPKKETTFGKAIIGPAKKEWIEFSLKVDIEPGKFYFAWVEPDPNGEISWHFSRGLTPTGVVMVEKSLPTLWRSSSGWSGRHAWFCMKIDPAQKPYPASNALTGVTRPEKWTNIWVSDPANGLSQWLELDFKKEITFNKVEITFDTDLDSHSNNAEVLKEPCAAQCAKDYALYADGKKIAEATGNYHRKRVHAFKKVKASKLKLEITATNGAPFASVYEIRVYNVTTGEHR